MHQASRFFGRESADRGREWILLGFGVVSIGLLLRQPLIVLLAGIVTLVLAIVIVWQRFGLRRVNFTRTFSQIRAFPGDEIELEMTVENLKLLPLPWLEVEDKFPADLDYPGLTLEPSAQPHVQMFRTLLAIGPYQRVRRRYRVICKSRGYVRFGNPLVRTGDVFGFATVEETREMDTHLLIYPTILPVTEFGLPPKQPFGDAKPRQSLIADPMQFSGVRPYRPGDPPRHIHWRASARTTELQSKQFDPTALPTLATFLDVNTFEHFWEGLDSERLELAISAAASISSFALNERRQVGLYVNAPLARGGRSVRIVPGRHPSQLGRILDALALVIPHTGHRVELLLAEEASRLPWGATVVVITGRVTSALEDELARLHRSGHVITLLAFGRRPTLPDRPGFRVYWLGEEVSRENLDELQLA